MTIDRANQCRDDLGAVRGQIEFLFLLGIGHVADLDQDRGNVGRLEDREAGIAVRIPQQLRDPAEFLHQIVGEDLRGVHRLALRQVDQDLADHLGLVIEVDAGDHIRLVLLGRQGGRLGVRGVLRQRVDRGAADRARLVGVGVKRHE